MYTTTLKLTSPMFYIYNVRPFCVGLGVSAETPFGPPLLECSFKLKIPLTYKSRSVCRFTLSLWVNMATCAALTAHDSPWAL